MNVWTLIYTAGCVQGLMLALALWRRPKPEPAQRLLAGWMLLVAVDLAVRIWAQVDAGTSAFRAMRLASLLPFLHGSLFYLYVRAVVQGRALRWRDLRHGLGFALGLLLMADLLLLPDSELLPVIDAFHSDVFRERALLITVLLFAWSLSYVAAATVSIARHRRRLRATRSDSHPHSLRWLVVMAASQCAIWGIALAQWLLPLPWLSGRLIYVAVAIWVLLLGYLSLLQHEADGAATVTADQALPTAPDAAAEGDPRFDAVAERLRVLMEERQLFRAPALSMGQLARRSGYPEYLVSAVINRRFGCPFWDFVNRYRVEAARERLLDPSEPRTALDIAYDCGFTSKSTFNAAFKRLLGETPSACRQRAGAARAGTVPAPRD